MIRRTLTDGHAQRADDAVRPRQPSPERVRVKAPADLRNCTGKTQGTSFRVGETFLMQLHRSRPEPRLSTFERCWLGGATGRRRAAPSRERDVVVAGGRWHGLTVQRVRERLQRGRTAMTARLLPNSPGAFLYGRGTRGGRRRCLGGPLAQEFGQGGVPCNKRCIGWTTIP